jgi:hypothetical protein
MYPNDEDVVLFVIKKGLINWLYFWEGGDKRFPFFDLYAGVKRG